MSTASAAGREERGRRRWVGVLVPALTIAVTVVAALGAGPSGGGVAGLGETLSGGAGAALQRVAGALPLGLAFAAGMVAAVNPCGFALLPGFLGVYLAHHAGSGIGRRLARALLVSATVSGSFVVLFGAAGLALSAARSALSGSLGALGLLAGVLLTAAAGRVMMGSGLSVDLGPRLASRLGGASRRPGVVGCAAYGVAYGLGSLGCALPAFLAVAGTALSASGIAAAALRLVLYALGLAFVFTAVTFAAAVFETGLVAGVRRLGRFLPAVSAGLLLVSGAYAMYYWLTVGGVLSQLFTWALG